MIHQDVWHIVTEMICHFSDANPSPEGIFPSDKVMLYFPVSDIDDINDKQAYLFSSCLAAILDTMNGLFSMELKFDFTIRQEWEIFDTVGHLYMYFIYLIEKERS